MTRTARRGAVRLRMLGAALAAGAALAVAPALPALAHNYPVASTPEDGTTIAQQPGTVSLTTNDALLDLGASYLEVVGPDGRFYTTGCAAIDGATVEAPAELGPPGEYTVDWQVVSIDGHPISGDFAFEWAPTDGVETAPGAATPVCADAGAAPGTASEAPDESGESAPAALGDVLWIGGGVLVALLAALGAWFAVRRRPGDAD